MFSSGKKYDKLREHCKKVKKHTDLIKSIMNDLEPEEEAPLEELIENGTPEEVPEESPKRYQQNTIERKSNGIIN